MLLHILRKNEIAFQRADYVYTLGGGTKDAATQLGIDENTVIKTLIFTNTRLDKPNAVVALMHGTQRVSVRKLERLSGSNHLRPCSPEEALFLTGYEVGGICPYGLHADFTLCFQNSIRTLDRICINAGKRGIVILSTPKAIEGLHGLWGDFSQPLSR